MSFPPISLAVYFPVKLGPDAELASQPEIKPSAMEQKELPNPNGHAHSWAALPEFKPAAGFLPYAQPSSSCTPRAKQETQPETWDTNTTKTFPCDGDDEEEDQYWEEGPENEDDDDHEDEDADSSDQDASGLSSLSQGQGQGPSTSSQHVWLSDEERVRVAFKRARTSAEKVDLDRSPFFPRTVAEYAGLKAGMLEARAARLRAKVRERERALLRAREGGAWRRVFLVGRSGRAEERVVPVYYGRAEEGSPAAPCAVGGSSMGADVASTASVAQGEAVSNTNLESHWGGPVANTLSTPGNWVQPLLYSALPVTFDWINFQFIPHEYTPSQAHQGIEPLSHAGQDWSYSQVNAVVDHPTGSVLPPCYAAGHQRASSAAILREVAAHAAFRHGSVDGNTQITTNGAHHGHNLLDDEDYDSDSSFTPSDYRPQHGMSKGKPKAPYKTWCGHNVASNFFTPINFTDDPTIAAEAENRATDRDEGHVVLDQNGHNKREQINCEDDTGLDKLELDGAPAGKGEANGKGKEEGYAKGIQLNVQNEDTHVRMEEGDNGPDIEESSAQPPGLTVEDNRRRKVPNPHAQVFTPSAASTFTPSDYNPCKFNQHTPSPGNIPMNPPPPPAAPQLATAPLSHRDGLSPFFSHPANPFTPTAPGLPAPDSDCDWPTVAELTSEGEGRIKRWDTNSNPNTNTTTPRSSFSHPTPTDPNNNTDHLDTTTSLPNPSLGRFLPLPRLRNTIDPRLDFTPTANNNNPNNPPNEADADATPSPLPWEVRAMAGERRWDLHGARRLWE
ncbi:predicted protein [Chaetomium globosum CBS 148.51]|uniref:Uncharacterized protein n=1 Tax=Chaetomium globosum (strain ATCC 6205 / CBS 148.51 / DSM 1962 / NBRC 6347 / NRRL 1970) TaxID=306901 RepID=Q2GPE3_CHAGB|nr:uncharacterized protein CHGG_10161 [Chaetomium globosum CBS 148.51]EAQ83757.1 predicted protein [Chaetomium globosum CBS 148.51]